MCGFKILIPLIHKKCSYLSNDVQLFLTLYALLNLMTLETQKYFFVEEFSISLKQRVIPIQSSSCLDEFGFLYFILIKIPVYGLSFLYI